LNIHPSSEVGGVRYFGVIKADSIPDAIKKFQPHLDSLNNIIKHSVKGLKLNPFEIQSVSFTDYENINKQWVIDTANSVISSLMEEE
jgi:hypothetical protein